jgi:hypothetical protein
MGRYSSPSHPLFNPGAPRPQCAQEGCGGYAEWFAVYGCLDQHTYEGYYCTTCLSAKKNHIKMNQKYTNGTQLDMNRYPKGETIWACQNTHPLVDFAFVNLGDPFRSIHDIHGERIFP